MNNGIWAAVLGSRIETQRLDVVANNIANADSPGYKSDISVFRNHLDYISQKQYDASRSTLTDINRYLGTATRFDQGEIRATGRMGDVAIDGDGYFVVQSVAGEAYTRAGSFRADTEGNLITASGDLVMGEGGPIAIPPGADFEVRSDGTVVAGAEELDRLRIESVQDPRTLEKIGGNLFRKSATSVVDAEPDFVLLDQALEGSNVSVVREMVTMVAAGRQFEAYQSAIRTMNDVNAKAGDTLARV